MAVETHHISLRTNGDTHLIDVTDDARELLKSGSIESGIVTVFVPGSTGGITTVEYEPGLLKDLPAMFERIIPRHMTYAHDQTWHDGNGHSHVRAALLGPSLTVPFAEKRMFLGRWQQIVFIDFDNRPRQRELIVQVIGD